MKKILLMAVGVLLVIGLAGAGTWAYFSDTETSTGNVFQAGTIDLTLGESGGAPINLTNMQPGDTASGTFTVTNVGTLPGSLYATSAYVDNDGATNPLADMSADDVAKMLLITAFTADTVDILAAIPDTDSDGRTTLFDMVNDTSGTTLSDYPASPGQLNTWYSYDADMTATEVHTYVMAIQFDTAAGNDYQGDGITWTITYLLTQQ